MSLQMGKPGLPSDGEKVCTHTCAGGVCGTERGCCLHPGYHRADNQ